MRVFGIIKSIGIKNSIERVKYGLININQSGVGKNGIVSLIINNSTVAQLIL